MAMTKEKLLEVMTTTTARLNDALRARTSKDHEALVTDDTCSDRGYSPSMLGGVGRGRKWVGNRVYTRLRSMGVRFDVEKYEKTIEVELDDLNDDPTITGAKIAAKLMESIELTDEYETYSVLRENKLGFDMDPLFGTHEYVEIDRVTGKAKLDANGNPIVLGSYSNDVAPADPADAVDPYFFGSKNSIVRVTRIGEDFKPSVKGGTPEQSEHTFDNDTVVFGWRARKLYMPGLPFYTIRCTKPFSAEVYQELKDLSRTFINDAGEVVSNKFTHLYVKAGSQAAAAARKLFGQQFLANGESNIYYTEKITVVEVDQHLL